jgi:hypothetical protein
MTSEFVRRYYIVKIIKNPLHFGMQNPRYVSHNELNSALMNIKKNNDGNLLFEKLDYISPKNLKRDFEKIYDFVGVEIALKRNYGYYIKYEDDSKAELLKDIYEKTEFFLLNNIKSEWEGFISNQTTSLDGRFDFSRIIYAIQNKLQIHIVFKGWYDNQFFDEFDVYVQPLHLREAHKHWHLVAYTEKKGIYSFSLDDRIKDLFITNKKVEKPIDFDPKNYFKYAIGILVDDTPPVKIQIEVANHHFKYLMVKKFHPTQKILKMPKLMDTDTRDYENPDKWGAIEVEVMPNYEFLMEIMKYNRWLKVIGPKNVVDYIRINVNHVFKYYQT